MKLYNVKLRIWDTHEKISNIKEFRHLTGAGLRDSKAAIEGAVCEGNGPHYLEIVVSAERLGNYVAWRELTPDNIHLTYDVLNEYFPLAQPTIYT